MERRSLPLLLLLVVACSDPLTLDVARDAIETHVRAVAPDIAPESMSFDVNEVLQIDEYAWEARFGEGEGSGAMLLRRSNDGWTVARYEDDATLDFMAGLAAEQWLAGFGSIATVMSEVSSAFVDWSMASGEARSAAVNRGDYRELDRLIEATRFGPSKEQFATLARDVTVPGRLTLNYEPGSLGVAAIAWLLDPSNPRRGCGLRLSRNPSDRVLSPGLSWIDDTSVVCTESGIASDSYFSRYERIRSHLSTDRLLRP